MAELHEIMVPYSRPNREPFAHQQLFISRHLAILTTVVPLAHHVSLRRLRARLVSQRLRVVMRTSSTAPVSQLSKIPTVTGMHGVLIKWNGNSKSSERRPLCYGRVVTTLLPHFVCYPGHRPRTSRVPRSDHEPTPTTLQASCIQRRRRRILLQ